MNKILKTVLISFFVISLILGIVFRLSPITAELYTLNIAPIFRIPLSLISSIFPFSVGEATILILVLMGIVTAVSGIILCITKLFSMEYSGHFNAYSKILFYTLAFIYFVYAFGFSSSYSRIPVSDSMGLEEVEMTAENIAEAIYSVTLELDEATENITYTPGKAMMSGMTVDEISDEVLACARKASEKYSFFQKHPFKAKPIALSTPLAYTGISGIYSFFTGESNVNTAFPEYTLPFTIAHEYSHQMGIGSEKEAEFAALLICLESDIPYVRYSAYSQVAITLLNILYEKDEENFYRLFTKLPTCLVNDIYLSSVASQKYSETLADEIATTINDMYLSASGDNGVVSYSLSSKLFVSYFLRRSK